MPRRRDDDGGFTLIELLVVVIILGVLAAIAIPSYLANVRKGNEAAVRSDVRSLGMTQFTSTLDGTLGYATKVVTSPDSLQDRGFVPSIGEATYGVCVYSSTDGTSEFSVGGVHSNGSVWVMSSEAGGVVKGVDQTDLAASIQAAAGTPCTVDTHSF